METFPVMFGRQIVEFLAWPTETRVRHYITAMGEEMVQW